NTAAADPQAVTARDASAPPPPPLSLRSPAGPLEIVRPMSGPSSVSLFWWILLGLVGVGIVFSLAYGPPGLLIGGVIILLVLPGLQLLSGVVVMFVLLLSARLDRSYQLWQLGKIFLGVLAGAGAGFAIMWLLYIGFSHH
ncbi:MAG TPA: hypothetical protein VEL76_15660, partial [Gemmataceae bacterium]|nr:hypothetical protein [Gemmataceae bacterium]